MKILLGCGDENRPGWAHHDRRRHSPHVDVAHDLELRPWPWANEVAERIEALDVLEHLADTVAFMDECWRILAPGGRLVVRVPHWQHVDAWIDPTHKRAFHPDTFSYFDPSMEQGQRFGRFYTDRAWRLVFTTASAQHIQAELEKLD